MSHLPTALPDGAIHALRTPLAALQSAIDVFALPPGAQMRAEAEDIARRQVRRLTELVAELDGFHRLQQMAGGGPGCAPVALRLAPMLAQAWTQVGPRPEDAGSAPPAVPPSLRVTALPEALQPALAALLRHAVRHGLRLEADVRDGRIRLRAGPPGPQGPQDPQAGARPLEGGLELLRRVARASDGSLRLDPSDPDGGFCLELPLAPDGSGIARKAG